MPDIDLEIDYDKFYLSYLQSIRGHEARYYNQKFLDRGGNGTTFLVTCCSGQNFGIQLVLKVFHKISNQRRREAFLEEISFLRQFDHPAIVKLFDEGDFTVQDRTYPFAVMEYVPFTVRQALTSSGINRMSAIRITLNCLSALNYIHKQNPPVTHRDLKPENILISEMGAKISDFGLARQEEVVPPELNEDQTDEEENILKQSQWPAMPRCYRTPELVRRARERKMGREVITEVTPASDIYQIGTVLYELLTGHNPQKAPKEIVDDIQLDIREIRGVQGQQLREFVLSTLQYDPNNRPTAENCLWQLNQIYKDYCGTLYSVTNECV